MATPNRNRSKRVRSLFMAALVGALIGSVAPQGWAQGSRAGEELMVSSAEPGQMGGRLVVSLRTEPKTFNPVVATDSASREVIGRMMADLVHINRASQQTELSLAASWKVSRDGRRYTMRLRRGLRFSDGHPVDADDVVFTFRVYLDEQVHSPQRELLLIGGKPVTARKLDAQTVEFELAQPYAPAERLFDSIAILPRHLLEESYTAGKFAESWGLTTPPNRLAGLGAFRLKEYVPGQRIVLERNPHFWKVDRQKQRLPYLDEIVFVIAPNEDAQVIRFQAGETDLVSRINARNFSALERDPRATGYRMMDAGPGLEYSFLFFNLNHLAEKNLPEVARKQAWFRDARFRQAVSAAIDREGLVRLVYQGRATALSAHVTPGNRLWVASLPKPEQSLPRARQLLREAGFSWNASGGLLDAKGQPVEFTIVVSASNAARSQMATIIQDDLKNLGIRVQVVPMEFRSLLDRVFNTFDYEAAISGLVSGDVDPAAEMNVWMSGGATHLWNLGQKQPSTAWEKETDELMQKQLITLQYGQRKKLYDRVQQIVAENLPLICLVSPNVLLGVKDGIGNVRPAILEPYVLWNAEELFLKKQEMAHK